MKFTLKNKYTPKAGDERTIQKFALFPICIGKTIIWLENVTIKQKYCPRFSEGIDFSCWENVAFNK
jgi:hypothetical protein